MKTIFFNQRSFILCEDSGQADKDTEGVIVMDNGPDTMRETICTFDRNEHIRRLYFLCRDINSTYDKFRTLFTEVDAAGGLIRNSCDQYLMILRNGIWDLPKGKKEKGEQISETAIREVMEECGIQRPELKDLICITDHTYHRDGQFVLKHTYWYAMQAGVSSYTRPQTEEGITSTAWIPAGNIAEYAKATYPSIREVLKAACLI